MADATALPPYSNKSSTYLAPVVTLGVIALALVVTRIYTRLTRTGRLHADDWLIVVAEPLSLTGIGIAIAAVASGWGKPAAYFTPNELVNTIRLNFVLQTVWIVTFCLVRLSVACSLLRFETDKLWRWPLYFIMVLQVLISSSYFIMQFAQCRPISANWDNVPGAKCWDLGPTITYGYVIAGVYITMDLVLSLMPIRLTRTLHRSTSEKILIGVLMALGLSATAIACAKLKTFAHFGEGDIMQATIVPSIYTKVEEQVGIIASSLPCLKGPVENLLKKLGLLKEHQLTRPSFVGEFSMPRMMEDTERGSGDDTLNGKAKARVDSVAVALGNKGSNSTLQAQDSNTQLAA
ncbi:hypothetical protein T440DRAFT_515576 [Plenodomus tracheiphilus IPT5]|uniref:Rhodopsin domain-containing protein n=1 Tax=Plenodomus tracheiphilus IPT5 TaxID=1408161 RepID=A0A6A7BDE2_9PLEO|nr:hypothetical protein T440DRAFT_515576 [Plenodomus tracheiphilus IPT5]